MIVTRIERANSGADVLLDNYEDRTAFNGVARIHFDLLNLAGDRAVNLVFHLHGFHNHQPLAFFHVVTHS